MLYSDIMDALSDYPRSLNEYKLVRGDFERYKGDIRYKYLTNLNWIYLKITLKLNMFCTDVI
jgi:hypothetical protein